MGASLGTVSIDFNAEVAKLVSGTEKINKHLESIGHNVLHAELLGFAIERSGELALEAGRKIAEMVSQTIEADANIYRMASALGIANDQLQGLASAAKISAGMEVEEFTHDLVRMASEMHNAATKGGDVADAVTRLGLDAKQLAAQSPDKMFLSIVEGFEKVKGSSLKLGIGKDLFGEKKLAAMLPLLNRGHEQIERMVEEAKQFGSAISDIDAARVTAVAEESARLADRFEGVKQQLVVALSPALLEILKDVESLFPAADTMRKDFGIAIQSIGVGVGVLLDDFRSFEIGAIEVIDEIFHAAKKLSDFLYSIEVGKAGNGHQVFSKDDASMLATISNLNREAEKAANYFDKLKDKVGNKPWPHASVDHFFKNMQEQSDKAADSLEKMRPPAATGKVVADTYEMEKAIKKLRTEIEAGIATAGMTDFEKKVAELKRQFVDMPDSLKQSIASLKELAGQQASLQQQQKDIERIKSLAESAKTPFVKWGEEIAKMNELLREHKITQTDFDAAKRKLTEDAFKGGNAAVAAMTRRFDFQMPGNRTADPAQQLRQQQLDEQRKATQGINDIRDNTKRMNDSIGGIVDLA